ncbi:MAG TPA: hypothetical protein DIT64_21950 [Verrucomicrobiales bacterium]|nr:hypothetical protein [Verrucomicrobiales bacterium]
MSKSFYLHTPVAGLEDAVSTEQGLVILGKSPDPEALLPMDLAVFTARLARKLGVKGRVPPEQAALPYDAAHDNLIFDAPLAGLVTGRRMRFLRGWKDYGSCVKCFNGIGLLGEHVLKELRRLQKAAPAALKADALAFLRSRKTPGREGGAPIFTEEALAAVTDSDIAALDLEALAIWKTYAARPIVCSTSSNMGISLHEALRFMQSTRVELAGRSFTILNDDEGWLIIWCPDEQADFMNAEKTEHLRALETEQPPLTVLHTYINRKQRDPGALKDALDSGGYFFPTNPQSADELQNLLANSLADVARERRCTTEELLADEKSLQTLRSLGCAVEGGHVVVRGGVEGGLFGLMTGYLVMLDETLPRGDTQAVSTWNQASIGAALAAAVLADLQLREPDQLPAATRAELKAVFPAIDSFLSRKQLGKDLPSRIHGVFDLANLQSLAQLLGVVVERHLSGRGTAYVGLGSSSYANGNRCYEILKESLLSNGPFMGKETFHPATHTLNPIAQALIYADDMHRAACRPEFAGMSKEERAAFIIKHARKPEPAGAAAMAGYLLSRLDDRTLSIVELAAVLRLAGFDSALFLEFAGFNKDVQGTNWWLQEASEEGPFMETLARQFLQLLDRDLEELCALARKERVHSRLNYRLRPLDPPAFEALNPAVNIYLTGDNTRQPKPRLVLAILERYETTRDQLAKWVAEDQEVQNRAQEVDFITLVNVGFSRAASALKWLQEKLDAAGKSILAARISSLAQKS